MKGYKQISMEQIIAWNPQVIFVQDRYPKVIAEINQQPAWQAVEVVKNHRVYLIPEYAKTWGYPMPEALALGELWMAKQLYPEKFRDVDMQKGRIVGISVFTVPTTSATTVGCNKNAGSWEPAGRARADDSISAGNRSARANRFRPCWTAFTTPCSR